MQLSILKTGAVLVVSVAAFSAASAQSEMQVRAGSTASATERVVKVPVHQSSIAMLPSPAPGTWPILISGFGMMAFATRRRVFAT